MRRQKKAHSRNKKLSNSYLEPFTFATFKKRVPNQQTKNMAVHKYEILSHFSILWGFNAHAIGREDLLFHQPGVMRRAKEHEKVISIFHKFSSPCWCRLGWWGSYRHSGAKVKNYSQSWRINNKFMNGLGRDDFRSLRQSRSLFGVDELRVTIQSRRWGLF